MDSALLLSEDMDLALLLVRDVMESSSSLSSTLDLLLDSVVVRGILARGDLICGGILWGVGASPSCFI